MIYRRQSGSFQFKQDQFSKIVKGISKNYHEDLLINKLLQTKPQVKSMNINYYGLY